VFGSSDDEWDALLDSAIMILKDQARQKAQDVAQRAERRAGAPNRRTAPTVFGSEDGTVQLWDANAVQPVATHREHTDAVTSAVIVLRLTSR